MPSAPPTIKPRPKAAVFVLVRHSQRPRKAVAASVTTHTIAIELLIKLALTHVFVNDVT